MEMNEEKYYIVLVSVHGLLRGENLELGRDADTGGQILYLVQLAKALAAHPDVKRVDIFTRQIVDTKIDPIYSQNIEPLSEKANIIRIPCGPRRYLRKEALWPYLDGFIDGAIRHIKQVGSIPNIIHGHYADAGYVGAHLASLLEVPFVFTGHSLGREKYSKLLQKGLTKESIQEKYNISTRIEAEEFALSVASLVIASTTQEIDEQYSLYENYYIKKMKVIPPGVNIENFTHIEQSGDLEAFRIIEPFLKEPKKAMILAISRADERKNINTLIDVYGENKELQKIANLVLILGNREDLGELDNNSKKVITSMLFKIDKYNLYGKVAYPKTHLREQVPALYRLAAKNRGVFVNIALTEPFGLTLLESASCGLPLVATNDGGPQEIINNCKNGYLVDPMDKESISRVVLNLLHNSAEWGKCRQNGIKNVKNFYTWSGHAKKYIEEVKKIIPKNKIPSFQIKPTQKLSLIKRLLICDIDNTLLGDSSSLVELVETIKRYDASLGFGVATGRNIISAKKILQEWGVPTPELFITSVGSEIHYGENLQKDKSWSSHIDFKWNKDGILEALRDMRGIYLQPQSEQRDHKVSFVIDKSIAPSKKEIIKILRSKNIASNVIISHDEFLDFLPIRASKGHAVRYMALKWNIPFEQILVAGDSGNDAEMLKGGSLAVVVGNYSKELDKLKGKVNVYFAESGYAKGILEGISYYDFFGGEV